MGKIFVTGAGSTIAQELLKMLSDRDETWVVSGRRFTDFDGARNLMDVDLDCDRYLFAHGLMRPLRLADKTVHEIAESLAVNLISTVQLCDHVLAHNDRARICVIGSESAFNGSYDTTYALAKAALHAYVRWRDLGPGQQLNAVSPDVIEDSGMTQRRQPDDLARVMDGARHRPRGRLLQAEEVARLIYDSLYLQDVIVKNQIYRLQNPVTLPL